MTPAEAEDQIQASSGATITSSAVVAGVNEALAYWKANFSGGAQADMTGEAASDSKTSEEAN